MKNIEIIRNESATAAEKLAAIISTTTNSRHPAEDAEKLLEKFGSIANVIESPAEALAQTTGKATAEKLAAILPIVRLYEREKSRDPEKITNARDLEAYCKSLVMGEQAESFYIIAVNSQCHVLGARKISQGDIAEVSAYPRQIARAALDLNAFAIFLCHNHPGGTCAPSAEDIATTLQIKKLLDALSIKLLDHMVIAGSQGYSLRQHGDF